MLRTTTAAALAACAVFMAGCATTQSNLGATWVQGDGAVIECAPKVGCKTIDPGVTTGTLKEYR